MAFLLHSSPQEEDGGGRRRGGGGNRSGQGLHSCLTKSRNRVIRESDVDVEEHADANLSSSERSNNLDPSITAPPRARCCQNPARKTKEKRGKMAQRGCLRHTSEREKRQIEGIHALLSQSATAAQTQPNAAVPLRHRRLERDAAAAARRWNARRPICSNSAELLRPSDGITKTHAHTHTKTTTFTDVKKCGSRTRTDKKQRK